MEKLRERFSDPFILVAGVVLFIGVVLVIDAARVDDEPTVKAEAEEETIADLGRERALDYYAEGFTVLALEYGIRLDEREVRALLDDVELWREIGDGLAMGIIFLDWWDSPADRARTVKDALLERGDVPSEFM